jgi:hypothetical protein
MAVPQPSWEASAKSARKYAGFFERDVESLPSCIIAARALLSKEEPFVPKALPGRLESHREFAMMRKE